MELDNGKKNIRLQCFFYFMLPQTGWVGALNLDCPQARETQGTPLLRVSFVFFEVLSRLLLQHDTVDRNAVWNLRSRIKFRLNQHEKILVTYLVMKCRFSATSHVLFLTDVTAFLSHYSYFAETLFL